jgi:hypothetical protein
MRKSKSDGKIDSKKSNPETRRRRKDSNEGLQELFKRGSRGPEALYPMKIKDSVLKQIESIINPDMKTSRLSTEPNIYNLQEDFFNPG